MEEVEELLQENELQNTDAVIQSLVFEKEVFQETSEAIEWASTHGFMIDTVEETENNIIITQLDPSELSPELKTIEIRRGVTAVVGVLRPIVQDTPFLLSLRNEGIKLSEDMPQIIELAKVVDGIHQSFGQVQITQDTLISFVENFKKDAYGVELSIDYDHETREAAGWVRDVFLSNDGVTLLGEIKWTPKGALSLKDKEFRYFSPEFSLNYVHPHTGIEHGPTLLGGALVNRPFLKMNAIVGLKEKQNQEIEMDTIKLSDHNAKVEELTKQIETLKLGEESTKTLVDNMKAENVKLSEELNAMKEAKVKEERDAKHNKLFTENKINKAQLEALNEGKELYEVLELGEMMNTNPKGTDKSNDDVIVLTEAEKEVCQKLNLTEEEFVKYNR